MSDLPSTVAFLWLGVRVPVRIDEDHATGEEANALAAMAHWTPGLRVAIEKSCFADYLERAWSIGAGPTTFPVIKAPADIWKHVQIDSVRPEGNSHVIVYAMPSWQETLHHEWCIEGIDTLHYVGQFLGYPADGYRAQESASVDPDAVIARLGHFTRSWQVP